MPIKSFADETTRDIQAGINSKVARRVPQAVWKSARRKMDVLAALAQLSEAAAVGLPIEALSYDKPGYHSVRVNDQFRLIFRFQNGDIYDLEIADPKWHQPGKSK